MSEEVVFTNGSSMIVGEGVEEKIRGYSYLPFKLPILVWHFWDAPENFQKLSSHGGDEDWVAFVPEGIERPDWIRSGTPFGYCDVSEHKVEGGTIFIGAHS